MFFRYQQTANLITLDDAFAQLANVLPNGDLAFTFTYTVSPGDVISRGAHTVSVKVLSRYVPVKNLMGDTQPGFVDATSLVNNVRSLLPDAKTAEQQRDKYVIAKTHSDILNSVNSEIVGMLAAQVPPARIPQLNAPKLQLISAQQVKQSNDPQPLLHRVMNSLAVPNVSLQLSASMAASPKALIQDMITRQGLDPSCVLSLTPRAQPEVAVVGGLSNTSTAIERSTDPASQLANFYLFPPSTDVPPISTDDTIDNDMVNVMLTKTTTTVDVSCSLVIPTSRLTLEGSDLTSLFVQFDLIDTSGEPIDTVIKALNVAKELQVYYTPKLPPIVTLAVSPSASRATLQIKQQDPGATAVQIFRKVMYVSSPDVDQYTLIGTYDLVASQRAIHVQVSLPQSSAAIYRVIPVGVQNTLGFEFTNVVVKPARLVPIKSVGLTGLQIDTGIQLEARNLPVRCVAIQFLRWNLTTHESAYSTVSSDVGFIDPASRAADLITTIDSNVTQGNIYRYVARLIYVDGSYEDAGSVIMEFVTPAPGRVNTSITNLSVSGSIPDVSFTINTVINNTSLDAIKQMLGSQDLQQYFQGDIQNQRDQLANLIAHSVQRVDLMTGVRESFGTLTTSLFVDSTLGKSNAVSPLQYGHTYRYEIYPLLRAPETMFDGLVKQSVDGTTKKAFSFSPAKFLHPLALNQGVIATTAGAGQRYAKDPMSFGVVGDITTVEASFDNATALIIDQTASPFNRSLNIVTWQVQGDITQVDHFIIMKLVNGVMTLLGKAHSEFPYGVCQYFHPLTNHDNGSLSYVIVPVMNDYQVGPSATTNPVIVDVP